jgi:hypothetical protein
MAVPFLFSAQVYNATAVDLIANYFTTGGIIYVPLVFNYTAPVYKNQWSMFYAFPTAGIYDLYYIVYNAWGISTITSDFVTYAYHFPYPLSTKLTIHVPEYRDCPTDMFYVYLGVSERVCLFDFRTTGKFGNWEYISPGLMWDVWYGYQCLNFIVNQSGVKSVLPAAYYFNLTLQFDLKTNATALLVLINPTHNDYDYLLNTTLIAQSDDWMTVRIPWYMFQRFSGASNVISELGFFGRGWYTIANVFLARYSAAQPLLNSVTTYSTNETTVATQQHDSLESVGTFSSNLKASTGSVKTINSNPPNYGVSGNYRNTWNNNGTYYRIWGGSNAQYQYAWASINLTVKVGSASSLIVIRIHYAAAYVAAGLGGAAAATIYNFQTHTLDLLQYQSTAGDYNVLFRKASASYVNATGYVNIVLFSGFDYGAVYSWYSVFDLSCYWLQIQNFSSPISSNVTSIHFPTKSGVFNVRTTAVYLSLAIDNSSPWNLYFYYFPNHTYVHFYPVNYAHLLIPSSCYNNSLFFFKFNSTGILAFQCNVTAFYGVVLASRTVIFTPPPHFNELSVWYNFSNRFSLLQIFYYDTSWHVLTILNKTQKFWQFWLNTSALTIKQLQFFFVLYNASWSASFQLRRLDFVIYSSYRLESEVNRQSSDMLSFTQQYETLMLVDFAGRVIYEQLWSSRSFIDINLDIAEFILTNNAAYPVWFSFTAWGHSVSSYLVIPGMSRIINLLMDDYDIKILGASNQLLDERRISISSNNGTIIGSVNITYPFSLIPIGGGGILELLWAAIQAIWNWMITPLQNPWDLLVWAIILLYCYFKIEGYLQRRKVNQQTSEEQDIAMNLAIYKMGLDDRDKKQSDEQITHKLRKVRMRQSY